MKLKLPEASSRYITTPIHAYTHPSSGSRVTVIGTIHAAQQPNYYPTIQDVIDTREAEGAKVHYEKLKPSTTDEVRAARPASRYLRRLRRIHALAELPYTLFEDMSMVKQVEELTYRETWENHDATRLEMARHIDGPSLFLLSAASKGVLSVMKCLDAENRRALALTSLERMVANNDNSQVGRVAVNSLDLTILGYRNDIALNAYDELQVAEPGREAVLLWGQGHLIGLDEGFSQRGFVKTDVQQLLAIDLDVLSER